MRCIVALAFMLIVPAVADSPSHLNVWWMDNYQTVIPQQDKLPPGVLVFVSDDNPETTDYHVTAYYRNHSNELRWVEGIVAKTRGWNGSPTPWTTKFLRADDHVVTERVIVFGWKQTGYKDQTTGVCCGG